MGMHAVLTTSAHYDDAFVATDHLLGTEGHGRQITFSALDSGRLGIAAVAVGLAQAALDESVNYARERTTFGRRIVDHQVLGFLLADMDRGPPDHGCDRCLRREGLPRHDDP